MDMSRFAGSSFIKVPDVVGRVKKVIADVVEGKFGPVAEFTDGTKLALNATNVKTLCLAYGSESSDWIDVEIELYVGKTVFQGKDQDSVLVEPVSEKKPSAAASPRPKAVTDFDDEVPF